MSSDDWITDGIAETKNGEGKLYRIAQLCEVIRHNWDKFAETIKQAVIEYITWHIGQPKVYDDLTIVHDQINFAG